LSNRLNRLNSLSILLRRQVSYGVPLVAGCEPCPTDSVEECPRPEAAAHYGNYVGFNCQQPATYNPLATLFLNTQVC
jgi:hypothetical protein